MPNSIPLDGFAQECKADFAVLDRCTGSALRCSLDCFDERVSPFWSLWPNNTHSRTAIRVQSREGKSLTEAEFKIFYYLALPNR